MKRGRSIRHPESAKLICVKIVNAGGQNIFDRVTRQHAADMIAKHDNVSYTSKSRYHKFLQNEMQ